MTTEREKVVHQKSQEMGDVSFIESARGGKLLIYKNFMYRIHRKCAKGSYWKCASGHRNFCKARLTLTDEIVVKMTGKHFHEDDSRIIEKKRFCLRLKDKIKREPYVAVSKIYREELAAVATSNRTAWNTPGYASVKTMLYNARCKLRPSLLNAEEITPPDELQETVDAEIPLHVEDRDKRNVEDGDKKSYIDLDLPVEVAGSVENNTIMPLKSTRKAIHSNIYTFKIPNFYSLPEVVLRTKCKSNNTDGRYFLVDSQTFEFAAATWRFTFHTDLHSAKVYKTFLIDLERLTFEMQRQHVFYSIFLLDANGEKYAESRDVQLFDEKGKNFNLSSFENRKHSYDRRDTLTLTIHLMCDEPARKDADQDSLTVDRDKQVLMCDKLAGEDADQDSLTMDTCRKASMYDKPAEEDADQDSLKIDRNKQTLMCDKPAGEDADHGSFKLDKGLDTLSENFKNLFANEESCDTTLRVGDNVCKVHKAVLIARSSVFAAMFLHDMSEKQTDIITIPDCDSASFKEFLEYLYCGELELSVSSALHLYETSNKYDVQELKEICIEFLIENLATEGVCDVAILADKYDDMKLFLAVQGFFNENMNEIFRTPEWEFLTKNNYSVANKLLIAMATMKVVK